LLAIASAFRGRARTPARTAAGDGGATNSSNMPLWSMDEWQYLEREVVSDPSGRQWTVALMDVLGQEGDPDMPNKLQELQYSSGRYFTLVYSPTGGLQRERGYAVLAEAEDAYRELLAAVMDGSLDPTQPVFREGLED
jgi:hypothetical protein